jgi:aminoglycoside phosphotransferase
VKSSSLPTSSHLPARVRAAASEILGGDVFEEEFAWMSWAGTVWKLTREARAVYVKRAADLEGERNRLVWLADRWPVPEVLGYFRDAGNDWLLTRGVEGVPMYHASVGWEPARVACKLGEILRDLHATDASDCPFGIKKRGHVLTHGDFCLPNVLVHGGKLSAVVDVGRAGLASPEDDLAAGLWSLQYNYGDGLARDFLNAYGWPPMGDAAIEKLRRRYGRKRRRPK